MPNPQIIRGEVYFADLNRNTIGSEQRGTRPVVIVSNDQGNKTADTVIVIPLTSKTKPELPTHYHITESWLPYPSTVLTEQIRAISKSRLQEKIGDLDEHQMFEIYKTLMTALGLME